MQRFGLLHSTSRSYTILKYFLMLECPDVLTNMIYFQISKAFRKVFPDSPQSCPLCTKCLDRSDSLCVSLDWYLNPPGTEGKSPWALSASSFTPCLTPRGKEGVLFDHYQFLHVCLLRSKTDLHPSEDMTMIFCLQRVHHATFPCDIYLHICFSSYRGIDMQQRLSFRRLGMAVVLRNYWGVYSFSKQFKCPLDFHKQPWDHRGAA